ncbi:MAG: SLBB domain-containing protein [Desulfosarcina sp.]|nr:SLBB domain-containing protein [Desulfosarcina sp.]MBC2743599.1 SLBB domain-containing protein [Desulfosarcina sp.]MBC2766508.1 NADH dehydrogenase subunit [Desulfosarcina sp.]
MNKQLILKKIRDGGVIGAGGAGFPTYKKLETPVNHIIANGAECEPLLYKDREVMIRDQEFLFQGLSIMKELTGAQTVTIAVKRKNKDILDLYKRTANKLAFNLFMLENVYPAGDEYILVYEIIGRRIPPGGIPLQVGAVVDNVETIINIARAVNGHPVTDKYVTVTGAVKKPLTAVVPVGTSFHDCIEAAGGSTADDPTVLTGGVMMGGVQTDLSLPVTKTIGGLIVLPSDHYLVGRKTASKETYRRIGHGQCDQCSICTELCPRYLLGYPIQPHLVMRTLLMTGEAKNRHSLWAQYCCECNICSLFACPEGLDPKNICSDAKQLLQEIKQVRQPDELAGFFTEVHPIRKGREVPIEMLTQRLGLNAFEKKAAFAKVDFNLQRAVIPLDTHIGAPALVNVAVGDTVKRGDLIGIAPDGQLGCSVHASIDGKVTTIDHIGIHIRASNF